MTYAWDNDSTQNAHIKQMRDLNTCRIMGKECKTMTNREKFAEKILDIACNGNWMAVNKATLEPIKCQELPCEDCLFCVLGKGCDRSKMKKWANSEYVEPPVDWSKVAVDTPILVNTSNGHRWVKRYFAKYENGSVFAWNNGATSWSSEGHVTAWGLAKLPERSSNEEINE